MEKYAPNMMELASRDVVSRAEQTEINEGRGVDGCVLLDMRHLGMDIIRERLWQIREIGIDFAGVDITRRADPILPGMHYIMGGIKTDVWGRTPARRPLRRRRDGLRQRPRRQPPRRQLAARHDRLRPALRQHAAERAMTKAAGRRLTPG